MKFGKIVLQVNARIESIEEVRIFEMTSYVQDHSAAVCCPLASRAHVTSLVRCECATVLGHVMLLLVMDRNVTVTVSDSGQSMPA